MPVGTALLAVAIELRNSIHAAPGDQTSLIALLEGCPHCVCIKTADHTVILTNFSFDHNFLGGQTAVGLKDTTFLDEAMATVSNLSDGMIAAGCLNVDFEHTGLICSEGGSGKLLADLRTVKLSLDGVGQSTMAILEVTKIICERTSIIRRRKQALKRYFQIYQTLPSKMQACAILLSAGKSLPQISEELQCGRRTAEKYRKDLLIKFDLENVTQLVQMLCRLQDGGLGEFGIFQVDVSDE